MQIFWKRPPFSCNFLVKLELFFPCKFDHDVPFYKQRWCKMAHSAENLKKKLLQKLSRVIHRRWNLARRQFQDFLESSFALINKWYRVHFLSWENADILGYSIWKVKYTNPVKNVCKQKLRPLPILFCGTSDKAGINLSGVIAWPGHMVLFIYNTHVCH